MSLKYSLTFLVLSAAFAVAGLAAWDVIGWAAVVFPYTAVSFGVLAVAYVGLGPRVLCKKPTGTRPSWVWLILAPYFLLNTLSFWVYQLLSSGPAFAQVVPNLYFGRRLIAHEAKAVAWVNVLDLACEFPELRPLRELSGYRSMPVLDATAPTEAELRDAVAWLLRVIETGPVYVHCALGHGRSVCVVIAYLLTTGRVATVAEGIRQLQALRPGVRLQTTQRLRLRVFEHRPTAEMNIPL